MFWVSKVLAPAMLIAGVVAAATVVAQPPDRKGPDDKRNEQQPDRKGPDDKRGGQQPDRKGPMGPMGERPRPDATVDAWVKVLVEKIADPHDTVRDSARAALVHVGPQAIPTLRQLAEGGDNVKAVAARNVIAMIERHRETGGQPGIARGPGGPGGPGGGAFGPGGPMGRPGGPMGPMGPMGRPGGPMGLDGRPGDGGPRTGPMGPMGPMGPGRPMGPMGGPGDRGDRPAPKEGPDGRPGDRPAPKGPDARGPGGMDMAARIIGELKLPEREADRIRNLVSEFGPKMREMMEKVRGGNLDPIDARAAMEKIRSELFKELRSVLSEDQVRRVEELMQGPGRLGGERPATDTPRRPGAERPDNDAPRRPSGSNERPVRPDSK